VFDPWRIRPAISQLIEAPLGASERASKKCAVHRTGKPGEGKRGASAKQHATKTAHTHSPRPPSVRAPNPNHGWMTTIMHPETLRRPSSNLVASSMKTRSSECPWNLIIKFILKLKFLWSFGFICMRKR
jgi:hypothetical protein